MQHKAFGFVLLWLLLSTWSAWAKLQDVTEPEEAVKIINSYLARLQTSHTHLYSKHDPAYFELLDVFAYGPMADEIRPLFDGEDPRYEGIGVFTRGAEVVDSVPGRPADKAGLLPGDVVLEADGEPFHPLKSFLGKQRQTVSLSVKRGKKLIEMEVEPEMIQPREEFLKAIGDSAEVVDTGLYKIAYVRMWSYAGEEFHEELKRVLKEELGQADALLLDLRGRWGGAQPKYLGLFGAVPDLKMIPREGETFEMRSEVWTKPVGLLIDETVTSGKEILAYGFSKSKLGPVIGQRTAGAVVAGKLYLLPGGHALYLAAADVTLDGQHVEGVGVGPSHESTDPKSHGVSVMAELLFKEDIRFRFDRDQGVRLQSSVDRKRMMEVDQENEPWLRRVIESKGWPKASVVGEKPSRQFFCLVQHVSDPEFQARCLTLMTEAVHQGEASFQNMAYLEDRVNMGRGLPQKYGTQLFQRGEDPLRLWTLQDPERVEEFREEAGLVPLTEYLKIWDIDGSDPGKIMIPRQEIVSPRAKPKP